MYPNKKLIPLILAAGFISSNAFAQNSTSSSAEQKATRAEIETLTKRIEELAKKLDGDTKVRIMIVDKSESADGKTVERKIITTGSDGQDMHWIEKQDGAKNKKSSAPHVGIGIVMSPNTAGGGAKIAAVSPKGPAKNAGLQAGDIITSIDGKTITGKDSAGLEQARAALKNLKVGQPVKIAYSRAGKNAVAIVKADTIDKEMIVNREYRYPTAPDAPHSIAYATRWHGLNMTELNPQLGRYFGTSSGVLVLSPNKGFTNLQPGDVITKVDGKAVVSSRDVLKNMRGKNEGEKINLNILRDRKTLSISVTAPKPPTMDIPPPPPPPPPPPAPPKAPAPPKSPKTTNSVASPASAAMAHSAMFISDSGEATLFLGDSFAAISETEGVAETAVFETILLDDQNHEIIQ
jgi:S1-C subfamily serine protease